MVSTYSFYRYDLYAEMSVGIMLPDAWQTPESDSFLKAILVAMTQGTVHISILSQEPISQINQLQIIFILPCLVVDPLSSNPFMLKFRSSVCAQGNYKSPISSCSDASLNWSFIFFGVMEQNSLMYIFFSFGEAKLVFSPQKDFGFRFCLTIRCVLLYVSPSGNMIPMEQWSQELLRKPEYIILRWLKRIFKSHLLCFNSKAGGLFPEK